MLSSLVANAPAPRGVKTMSFPGNDTTQQFSSKLRTGFISLEDRTGRFKFYPALDSDSVEINLQFSGKNLCFD